MSKINTPEARNVLLNMIANSSPLVEMQRTEAEREARRKEREREKSRRWKQYYESLPLKSISRKYTVCVYNPHILAEVYLCAKQGDAFADYPENQLLFPHRREFYVGNLNVKQLNAMLEREMPNLPGKFEVNERGIVRFMWD